jgi:hypothetical protein
MQAEGKMDKAKGTARFSGSPRATRKIDHLIINKISGRVGYAIMSFGGFLV